MTQTSIDATTFSPETLLSTDGTRISYLSLGHGPAVIVVPGAFSVAAGYTAFARTLAEHFTVSIIERRGRGQSGPQGADYSITKECEDVLALQKKTGAAFIVGHSYGGLIALEAAHHYPVFTRVAVYEPGVSIDGSISLDWETGYKQKLAAKKYLDAFVEFSLAAGPDRARQTPPWLMKLLLPLFVDKQDLRLMLSLLEQGLREHQEVAHCDNHYISYGNIAADVLLMYGGKSQSSWVDLSMQRLATVLPHAQTRQFPTLDHFGIDKKSPAEVARAVSAFLLK